MTQNVSHERVPAVSVSATAATGSGYVDWPAIFAGAAIASAVVFLLLAFGAAVGLSLPSAREGEGVGGTGVIIAIGLWSMWATVSGHMAGAYVAGRLRRRAGDATEHESDVRDGLHGLAVWAVGLLVGAVLVATGAYTATRVAGEAASAASSVLETSDFSPRRYIADTLLRSTRGGAPDTAAASEEIVRILAASADSGTIPEQDRAYLASLVASRAGISEADAQARVDAAVQRLQEFRDKAIEAVETARKASVVSAFVLAASLAIAAAGAWWAATMGGRHRDEQTVLPFFSRWR